MSDDKLTEALKARIEQLETEQENLRQKLAEVELEQWQGRIDDLDVQVHLGAMELKDRLEPIVNRAREQLAEAKSQISSGSETASQASSAVKAGLEQAFDDLRAALRQAKDIVTS